MKYIYILTILLIIIYIYTVFFKAKKEKFSNSGMAISNQYCDKLAHVYHKPEVNDIEYKNKSREQIYGGVRRHTLDYETGNYFAKNNMLI